MNPNKLVKGSKNCLPYRKIYIKCRAISYVSAVINIKIKVLIQDVSKLVVKTTENAICIVCVLPYLCERPCSALVESGLIGRRNY
jgi:hypothetical protein